MSLSDHSGTVQYVRISGDPANGLFRTTVSLSSYKIEHALYDLHVHLLYPIDSLAIGVSTVERRQKSWNEVSHTTWKIQDLL